MVNRLHFFDQEDGSDSKRLQAGSFLVANPALIDNPFERSVIFLLQYSQAGVFGAVLNRPADLESLTSWKEVSGLNFSDCSIVNGGPVGGPVLALHHQKQIAEVEISGGVCISVDAQAFKTLSERDGSEYRIVLGLAAWSKTQLQSEISAGIWYQVPADPMHVFDEPGMMWQNFIREYGRQTLTQIVGERLVPTDPRLN